MSSWVDFVGYLAAFTVLATFCMNTIVPLRGLAIVSNILFMVYGIAGHLYPVFVLHAVLLPINVFKIVQPRHRARGSDDGQQILSSSPARDFPCASSAKVETPGMT